MWVVEEFDDESHLRDYAMPNMEDELLRSLIQIRNPEDWIRGVGHPIELSELSSFTQYLREELEPNTLHTYFATYFRD